MMAFAHHAMASAVRGPITVAPTVSAKAAQGPTSSEALVLEGGGQ